MERLQFQFALDVTRKILPEKILNSASISELRIFAIVLSLRIKIPEKLSCMASKVRSHRVNSLQYFSLIALSAYWGCSKHTIIQNTDLTQPWIVTTDRGNLLDFQEYHVTISGFGGQRGNYEFEVICPGMYVVFTKITTTIEFEVLNGMCMIEFIDVVLGVDYEESKNSKNINSTHAI